jgi:membrane fusion protein, multidrug efflux system
MVFNMLLHRWSLTCCFALTLFALSSQAKNYNVEEIIVEPFIEEIERTGKVAFKRTLSLSFKSSGYLTQLSVDAGDSFKKDKVLASLETSELVADKNATYAKLLQAKRDVARIEQLMDKNLSSEKELDTARTLVETTRSAYKVAFYNLNRSQIIAPFDGVVLARHTELGEYQSPGREILEVAAIENNRVIKVALTGNEINQVKLGQSVIVEVPQIGEMTGTVNRIPAVANAGGNLFSIDVLLPKLPEGRHVIAGQLAVVKINSSSSRYVYRLPIDALVRVDDLGNAVVVVQEGDGSNPKQESFKIFRLDNNFIYLDAQKFDNALNIVTRGWQNLKIKK